MEEESIEGVKQQVKQILKNLLDLRRLRIHSSGWMSSCVFVHFIALILLSQIQKTARERSLSDRYSPKLLPGELESLTRIRYSGGYKDIV